MLDRNVRRAKPFTRTVGRRRSRRKEWRHEARRCKGRADQIALVAPRMKRPETSQWQCRIAVVQAPWFPNVSSWPKAADLGRCIARVWRQ